MTHDSNVVRKEFVQVDGLTTELLTVDARQGSEGAPQLQVIVFPGNPGSSAFFVPFMEMLHERLGGRASVTSVTHVGHDGEVDHGGQVWSLQQQIDHKVAFLREHVLLPGRPPVLLVGHSIGAYMALQAVERVEADTGMDPAQVAAAGLPPIIKVVSVFPFLETDFRLPRQRRLRLTAAHHDIMGWVAVALSCVPRWLSMAFVRHTSKDVMDEFAVGVTVSLLRRHSVRNNFHLAHWEFQDLSRPFDWRLLSRLGGRVHVMGCPQDTWLSRQQFDGMVERLPGLQATWHDELTHAFCVSLRQSGVVAGMVQGISELGLQQHAEQLLLLQDVAADRALVSAALRSSRAADATADAVTPRRRRRSFRSPSPADGSEDAGQDAELVVLGMGHMGMDSAGNSAASLAEAALQKQGVQTRSMAARSRHSVVVRTYT